MKKYFILGGDCVFGVHTAFYLLEHAHPEKVICIGRNPHKSEPFTLGLGKNDSRYQYHQIHLVHEQELLFDLLDREKPEIIINYAAQGESGASWKRSWRYFETNATAMVKIIEELGKRSYLERFIQIGTSELYGSCNEPRTESSPINPSSPYAVSKAAFDLYLQAIFKTLRFPMNIVRPSNAYAPGQQVYRIVPRAIICGLTNQRLLLQGGGRSSKSYIHGRDLAKAIHLISQKGHMGRIYNVGPQEPISIKDLVALILDKMNIPFENVCETADARIGEDSMYWLDSSLIRDELGWAPEITLDQGIDEMIAWGKKYIKELESAPTQYVLHA